MAESSSATSGSRSPPRWIQGTDFDEFWAGVWRTDKGRAWAGSGEGLADWLRMRLSERPFFLSTPWEPRLQRRHFAQMWGQIFSREYENPALSDLFWVHELTHWACADLAPSRDFESWHAKWDLNELRASCTSEILIHGEVEGWDRDAFGRDVWARGFGRLGGTNPEDSSTWSRGSRDADRRRHAIRDGEAEPNPSVSDEVWLAGFKAENARWAELWRGGEWRRIDRGLALYGHAVARGDWARARFALEIAGHVQEFPKVPYASQATAFAPPAPVEPVVDAKPPHPRGI